MRSHAFAHGANDVANSVAPFASIYLLNRSNGVISKVSIKAESDKDSYCSGGDLDGKEYKNGYKVPDGKSYCATIDEVDYIVCKAMFPNIKLGAAGTKSTEFRIYSDEGVFQKKETCYGECAPGGAVKYTRQRQNIEPWILALGAFSILAALAMWGYRIIVAIGVKLTKLTPSHGFSVELGAVIRVTIATRIGLPVSITHCKVGATMGVGLVKFKKYLVN